MLGTALTLLIKQMSQRMTHTLNGKPPQQQEEVNLNDLPLPPPPSPTQLQQYEELNSNKNSISISNIHSNSNIPHQQQYHTRTLSSLSSMSSGSNTTHSSTHSLSPTPYNNNNNNNNNSYQQQYQAQQQQQQQHMSQHSQHPQHGGDMTSESSLSLEHYGSMSPMHSRQTSSSSCSLSYGGTSGVGSGSDNYMTSTPPLPPPPPPMPTQDNNRDMYIKNQHNSANVKLMTKQNENDMNSYNKTATAVVGGVGNQKAYNKFLKEYSNKLITQNSGNNTLKQNPNYSDNDNNSYHHSPHNKHNSNSTPKPFALKQTFATLQQQPQIPQQQHIVPSNSNNNSLPNVAALTATLNNQLKFDSCQVAPTPCSNIPIVDKSLINSNSNINNKTNSNSNPNNINNSDNNSNTTVTNETSATMASVPSVSEQQQQTASNTTNGTGGGDKPFEYVTLTGNVIRSVVAPGKGANPTYRVSTQALMTHATF